MEIVVEHFSTAMNMVLYNGWMSVVSTRTTRYAIVVGGAGGMCQGLIKVGRFSLIVPRANVASGRLIRELMGKTGVSMMT